MGFGADRWGCVLITRSCFVVAAESADERRALHPCVLIFHVALHPRIGVHDDAAPIDHEQRQ